MNFCSEKRRGTAIIIYRQQCNKAIVIMEMSCRCIAALNNARVSAQRTAKALDFVASNSLHLNRSEICALDGSCA